MYLEYFSLSEAPFSITPDPAYLYMSPRHQEALGHLLFGTGQYGGFVQLTGEVGTGKTTMVRTLLEQQLEGVEVAMLHNPRQSEAEFLQSICDELRAPYTREPAPTLVEQHGERIDVYAGTEAVIVDGDQSHLLNQSAAAVWLLRNEGLDADAIAAELDADRATIDAALDELAAIG